MTPSERLERSLSGWLAADAEGHVPDHLAEVLGRTVRTRQRPAWSSLRRWFPMDAVATVRLAPVPRAAWLVLLAVPLIVALGLGLAASAPPKLPPPFGLAANGLMAYGDGTSTVIVPADGGAAIRTIPDAVFARWSPDGARLAYVAGPADADPVLVVEDARGGDRRELVRSVAHEGPWSPYAWAPDGRRLVVAGPRGTGGLRIVDLDGGVTELDAPGIRHLAPGWSPDGRWISVVTATPDEMFADLTLIAADGSERRTLRTSPLDPAHPAHQWSPDPTVGRIAYGSGSYVKLFDLATDREVPADPGDHPRWFPDGTRLIQIAQNGPVVLPVEPLLAGEPFRREYPVGRTTAWCESRPGQVVFCHPIGWSPDGTRLVGFDGAWQWLLISGADGSGPTVRIPIGSAFADDGLSWQRIAVP